MFGKNVHMDERMLWIRGNVFKHSYVLACALLMANAVVQDTYGPWAAPWFENLLMLFVVITFTSVEMIVREVYATAPPATMRLTMAILTTTGVTLLVLTAIHLFWDGIPLWQSGRLTSSGSSLAMGVMNLLIPASYLVRQTQAKRRQADEED